MVEIERKWLVDVEKAPIDFNRDKVVEVLYIKQYYITEEIRVRKLVDKKEDFYYLTVKTLTSSPIVRNEVEITISKQDYEKFVKISTSMVEKTRFIVSDTIKYIIDVYENLPFETPFMIAEVEFQTEGDAKKYIPPTFFGQEVTGNKMYTNYNLAVKI